MEKAPETQKSKSELVNEIAQIRARLRQIDLAILAMQGTINVVPAAHEEDRSDEGNAQEAGETIRDITMEENEAGELRREKIELQAELDRLIDLEKSA